jgi:hypothetical protein
MCVCIQREEERERERERWRRRHGCSAKQMSLYLFTGAGEKSIEKRSRRPLG